jgi:malonyl-CoA O-methyltransferase
VPVGSARLRLTLTAAHQAEDINRLLEVLHGTVNKQAVAAAFGRAASGYTQHDELQRRSADLLLRQLARRDFAQVLDAGCGPGSMSRYWREAGSGDRAGSPPACWPRRSATTPRSIICRAMKRCRCRMAASIWRGATWRCSGATICARRSASCAGWCAPAAGGVYHAAGRSLPELNQAWQAIDDRPHANRFLSEPAARGAERAARAKARFIRLACRSPMR